MVETGQSGTTPETRIGGVGRSEMEYPKPVTPAPGHREGAYSRGTHSERNHRLAPPAFLVRHKPSYVGHLPDMLGALHRDPGQDPVERRGRSRMGYRLIHISSIRGKQRALHLD